MVQDRFSSNIKILIFKNSIRILLYRMTIFYMEKDVTVRMIEDHRLLTEIESEEMIIITLFIMKEEIDKKIGERNIERGKETKKMNLNLPIESEKDPTIMKKGNMKEIMDKIMKIEKREEMIAMIEIEEITTGIEGKIKEIIIEIEDLKEETDTKMREDRDMRRR